MTKNYVGGPDNMNEYWYPFDMEVANANVSLRDLFNRLIEEKLNKIENAKKIGAVTNILSLNNIKQMASALGLKLKSVRIYKKSEKVGNIARIFYNIKSQGKLQEVNQSPQNNNLKKLNLGCGFDKREGYLNIDLYGFHKPDIIADICCLRMLPSNYFDEIVAQDVLEHIPRINTKSALSEWNRLLKVNGIIKIRVPNLFALFSLFNRKENQAIKKQEELLQCLFGTQMYDGDFHHIAFTEMLLREYLIEAGFDILDISVKDGWLFDVIGQKRENTRYKDFYVIQDLLAISNKQEFLVRAYKDILGREPDKGGFDFYLSNLNNGKMTKMAILQTLLSQDLTLYKDILKSNKVDFESGWHGKEMWGDVAFRWTDGEGVLNIMHKARNFKIKYRCIHKYDDMELKVFADHSLIHSESMIMKDAWTEIDIKLDESKTPLKIKIKTEFFIPKLCGISTDLRKLGIAISEISCD